MNGKNKAMLTKETKEAKEVQDTVQPTSKNIIRKISLFRPETEFTLSVSLWGRVMSRFKNLTRSQMLICETFIRFPDVGHGRLAELVGVSVRTVERWKANPEFWQVIRELGLSQTHPSKIDVLLSAQLDAMLERRGGLDLDDLAWLEMVMAKTGQLPKAPQATRAEAEDRVVIEMRAEIRARAAELAASAQRELALDLSAEGERR